MIDLTRNSTNLIILGHNLKQLYGERYAALCSVTFVAAVVPVETKIGVADYVHLESNSEMQIATILPTSNDGFPLCSDPRLLSMEVKFRQIAKDWFEATQDVKVSIATLDPKVETEEEASTIRCSAAEGTSTSVSLDKAVSLSPVCSNASEIAIAKLMQNTVSFSQCLKRVAYVSHWHITELLRRVSTRSEADRNPKGVGSTFLNIQKRCWMQVLLTPFVQVHSLPTTICACTI